MPRLPYPDCFPRLQGVRIGEKTRSIKFFSDLPEMNGLSGRFSIKTFEFPARGWWIAGFPLAGLSGKEESNLLEFYSVA